MKKLLLIMLMITSYTYSQDSNKDRYLYLSYGVDAKNALLGSKPTGYNQALNWLGEFHIVEENFNLGFGYEKFSDIKFERKFISFGYNCYFDNLIDLNGKFSIQPSLEWSVIQRGKMESDQDPNRTYSMPSANINFHYDLHKNIAVQLYASFIPRVDTREIYHQEHSKVISSFGVKGVFKFNNH